MAARTRPAPNVRDPLSESTPGRRVHAAYLAAGYTRAEFTRELGVSYVTVDNWDKGQSISLENLLSAAQTLGYTMDELCYGHHPPRRARRATGRTEVLAVMQAVKAADQAARKLCAVLRVDPDTENDP